MKTLGARVSILLFVLIVAVLGASALSVNVNAEPDISVSDIQRYLIGKASPFASNAGTLRARGLEYNVDPRLIVAIAGAESTFGTVWRACPQAGFNAWSWFYRGDCATSRFDSFDDGIERVTRGIRKRYLDRELMTIPLIANTYCPGCPDWVPLVTRFYSSEMGGGLLDLQFNRQR